MANAITIFVNEFSYEMPDLTNIKKAAFTTTFHKLNNTYYPYWKDLVRIYLKAQDLWDILMS